MRGTKTDSWLSLAAVAASALAGALMLGRPPSAAFATPTGMRVTCWASETVRVLYWPLLVFLAAFAAASHAFAGRVLRGGGGALADSLRVLRPLLLWPPIVWLGFGAEWLGTLAASFFIPFGSALLAARIVLELHEVAGRRLPAALAGTRLRRCLGPVLCVAYFAAAALSVAYLERLSFNGGGDVVHYAAMTEALLTRKSLDLSDKFLSIARRQRVDLGNRRARAALLTRCHMKENAEGRIYSYHSFGFPLVAAVFQRLFGGNFRWLLLALFSLAGATGCAAAARANGAARADTLLVVGLAVLSGGWVLTSASFLPEMPGAALTAWGFWAVMAQAGRGRRAAATLVAALCCAGLPYLHIRFAPLAMALAGLFGIEGLLGDDEPLWRRKVPRLALFSILCLLAWACLYRFHQEMFRAPAAIPAPGAAAAAAQAAPSGGGGAYNYRRIFLSYPLALWGMFADTRGLAHLFPALWVLSAAPFAALLKGRRQARFAVYALAATAVVLLSCCTTRGALIGSCLRGRYLFQALPLLLPSLALVFPALSRTAKTWCLFRLLLPVFALAQALAVLGGHRLIDLPGQLCETLLCANLFNPFISCLETADPVSRGCGFAFAGLMLAGSALLLLARRSRAAHAVSGIILLAGLGCGLASHVRECRFPRHAPAVCLAERRLAVFHANKSNDLSYFENLVPFQATAGGFRLMLTDDSARCDGRRVFDLSETRYQRARKQGPRIWHPVRDVGVRLRSGAVLVRGRVLRGTGRLVAAKANAPLRESDAIALPPGPFSHVFLLEGGGRPVPCNVFLSMDGNAGEAVVEDCFFAPYSPGAENVLGELR